MASQLEYPEDDLDSMLDDELAIMEEMESERGKENLGPPARKSLEFATNSSVSLGGLRPADTNVGLGDPGNVAGKRNRSVEEEQMDSCDWGDVEEQTVRSPVSKKMKTSEPTLLRLPRMGERKVYRKLPDGEFQAVTAGDGTRLYLRMVDMTKETKVGVDRSGKERRPVGLCGVPFHLLTQEAAVETNRLSTAAMAREQLEDGDGGDSEQTELWVEKFRPRSYMELLSDDGTNRTLLMWLKLWDKLVFNKERKVKEKKEEEENKFKMSLLPDVDEELDAENRPKQKVALLHGPPGLGKTTLAHIVARHAGYKVVEVNASDDRSVEALKKKLESATQMRSVVEDKRPNCLIIDEIDGAPAPTINFLVSVLTGKQAGAKKKAKAGEKGVLRPIICICNELYTPALRPLRQLALVIPFPPTLANRLAGRLREITAVEKLKTDLSALLALCKKTDNDIRSCLSTLQFFRKRGKMLRATDVALTAVGAKDSQRSLFSVWDEVFLIPRPEKAGSDSLVDGKQQPANSIPSRYKRIYNTVSSCGEYDRLVAGVFENYLAIKFKDCGMQNVVAGMEWLTHFDLLHREMLHSQTWALMGHFAFPLVASHLLFASNNKQRISFPIQQSEATARKLRSENVLISVVSEMSPTARAYSATSVLVREMLPAILAVIQPTLRPVNTHLFSAKEKAELANVVDIQLAYNMTYQQERSQETGQYEYKMDPDVESVVCFPDTKRSVNLSYGTKQLVAHEIELERMRRIDVAKAKYASESAEYSSSSQGKNVDTEGDESPASVLTPRGSKKTTNHLQKLEAKKIEIKTVVARDFFGRAIKVDPAVQKLKKSFNNEIVKSDVWFKFREGYSNAVRRNVKMKDFM